MKSNFTRAALLALLSLAGGAELMAQRFTNNTGGTYNADCSGVIRLKSTGTVLPAVAVPFFDGTAALGQNNGATATGPIQGIVDYNSTAGGQQVQGAFYSTLFLSGGAKTVLTGVHIYGNACATAATTGYAALVTMPYSSASASTVYQGTFNYDAPSGTQLIFAENGASANTNRYSNLNLAGGAKSTAAAITLDGALTTSAASTLSIGANFNIANNTNATPSNVSGAVTVATGGTLTQSGTSAINVAASTGSVTVAAGGALAATTTGTGHINVQGNLTLDAGGTGTLALASGTYLDINGSFTNSFAGKTNMTFDPASTVAYTGASAQTIVNTVNTNKYGNLVFNGAGAKTVGGDIYAKGTVAIGDAASPNTPVTLAMGANVFDVDVTGKTSSPISYTSPNNNQFISGKVNLSGTLDNTVDYVMNNAQTQVHFSAIPTTFALDIVPTTNPVNVKNFDNKTDADRKIIVSYTGATGVLSDLKIGYTSSDVVSPFTGNESRFRMVEGYSGTVDAQKITGGAGIATNSNGADPRYVRLGGSIALNNPTNGGNVGELGNGSSIILTTVPNTFISIASGRWTNTNTWDEGSLPTALDNVEIRHLVYAGIASNSTASAFGTTQGTAGNRINMIPESESYPSGVAAANSILIGNYAGASLVVGNEDNGLNFNFHTVTTPGATSAGVLAGLTNSNINSSANITDKSLTSGINGLYITNLGSNPSIFGTAVITNNGAVNNKGIIEIGE